MGLRAQHLAATRQAIVDAFVELANCDNAARVTVAEVAAHSGISPATIYRHFPNRDALVAAAAERDFAKGVGPVDGIWTLDDLRAHLGALWGELGTNLSIARNATVTEAGREMRIARYAAARNGFTAALADAGLDPTSDDGETLVLVLCLLTSVHAFLDLHDRQGLEPERAADVVQWALRALVEHVGVDPDAIRFTDDPLRRVHP